MVRINRPSCTTPGQTRRCGFTLVELLVVIGIISVLISILLPALNSARRTANRIKCLSNMRSLGQSYLLYANDNKGGFPVARWSDTNLDKRWHDFIGRYVVGSVGVKIGSTILTGELNPSGKQSGSERQLWSPEIMNGNNALWGCPSWMRATVSSGTLSVDSQYHNGYAQNPYYTSPNDSPVTKFRTFYVTSGYVPGTDSRPTSGTWAKLNQYSKPAERCLLVESVHANLAVSPYGFPYVPDTATAFPQIPDGGTFSLDFNRHGRNRVGNKPTDPALNMLYVDGHAGYVSAREAYRAIRFQ